MADDVVTWGDGTEAYPPNISGTLRDVAAVPDEEWTGTFLGARVPTATEVGNWLQGHIGYGYSLAEATITEVNGFVALTVTGAWNAYTGSVAEAWANMRQGVEQLMGQWYPVGYHTQGAGSVGVGDRPGALDKAQTILRLLLALLVLWIVYRLYRDWR